jgi:hypothetical protein
MDSYVVIEKPIGGDFGRAIYYEGLATCNKYCSYYGKEISLVY